MSHYAKISAKDVSLATVTSDEYTTFNPSTRKAVLIRITGSIEISDFERVAGRPLNREDIKRFSLIATCSAYASSGTIRAMASHLRCVLARVDAVLAAREVASH